MTPITRSLLPSKNSSQVAWLSLLIPGLGQFLLKRHWRGVVIFIMTPILAYTVNWALVNQKIGELTIGDFLTSWLWLPFILFWLWNVLDARRLAAGRQSNALLGVAAGGGHPVRGRLECDRCQARPAGHALSGCPAGRH